MIEGLRKATVEEETEKNWGGLADQLDEVSSEKDNP